ncbi:Cell wall-active antibiotics response 4TMS YvqF [Fibrobacter sp. UWH9]|uniref:LiaF domain-containing protein n=1 Tax=unclassified Fibrobacter TaxID=2634177 RepID=UPI0009120250|nr:MULTISPECIES: LiaF domain-containing protein [unclassified Fibrobacter]OWV15584.1 hypothetical protein B7992_04160 [Fibrobacter sp. UWH1]SHH71215.1 Cell wall-active antibiotics response 4TMS YvqF [Fibrobacter sp. UWH9]
MKRVFFGLLVLAIGVMMLLRAMGIESFDWFFNMEWKPYIWPIAVILIGIGIIFHKARHKHCDHMRVKDSSDAMDEKGFMKIEATLSGHKYNLKGEDFSGAKINAFLGGVSLDLRNANFADESEIKIDAFMGGAEIFVPQDIQVKIYSSCICGGVKNDKPATVTDSSKTLHIHAECLFGGVDIKR